MILKDENNPNKSTANNMHKGITSNSSARHSANLGALNKQIRMCEDYLFPSNSNKDFSRAALALKDYVGDNTEFVRPLYHGITRLISNNPNMAKRYFQIAVSRSPNSEAKRIAERAMNEYC